MHRVRRRLDLDCSTRFILDDRADSLRRLHSKLLFLVRNTLFLCHDRPKNGLCDDLFLYSILTLRLVRLRDCLFHAVKALLDILSVALVGLSCHSIVADRGPCIHSNNPFFVLEIALLLN